MDSDSVMASAAQGNVCAVVIRSTVRWGSFADLPRRLEAAGYAPELEDGSGRGYWQRRDCRP
jgi:hypothetical protein